MSYEKVESCDLLARTISCTPANEAALRGLDVLDDAPKQYTTSMFGERIEIPAGMTEDDFWSEVNNRVKEAQYERLTQTDAAVHRRIIEVEQGAHPVENVTAMQYEREYIPRMRKVRR